MAALVGIPRGIMAALVGIPRGIMAALVGIPRASPHNAYMLRE